MREILIEQLRRRESRKHGDRWNRMPIGEADLAIEPPSDDLMALDEAIGRLDGRDPRLAEIVRLRYFAGLSVEETAEVLGLSASTVKRDWRYVKAHLASVLDLGEPSGSRRPAEDER